MTTTPDHPESPRILPEYPEDAVDAGFPPESRRSSSGRPWRPIGEVRAITIHEEDGREVSETIKEDASGEQGGADLWMYDEPRRANITCGQPGCHEEIEAYGEKRASLMIEGTRPYLWRHVGTGRVKCEPSTPPNARPYDGWAAHRALKEATR